MSIIVCDNDKCGWSGKASDLKPGWAVEDGQRFRVYACPRCKKLDNLIEEKETEHADA